MTEKSEHVIAYASYQGTPATRFDRDYYANQHRELSMKLWAKYGLEKATAFFPPADTTGTIAIMELRFRDQAAFAACMASPEGADLIADIPNYSDEQPVMWGRSDFVTPEEAEAIRN